ncbi:MAG: Coenzyme F420 hydrogenase/dehydrogenase, beta subunit C-terminal domain [Candidatus Thiodiazotropha taylori]|nr:Coenzyme F420 hydrogenase/dehydrogenase, beta subunit C-terminal domain [Candidatus Thiodiazotropha taylori]
MTESKKSDNSINSVIDNNYCIGCGTCAVINESPFKIITTKYGNYQATITKSPTLDQSLKAGMVCPFSNIADNENAISDELYKSIHKHDKIGRYIATYSGYVIDGDFRYNGSSGGLVTWLLETLLVNGNVDGVVHVGETAQGKELFEYKISRTISDIRAGAKSKYYPVTLTNVIREVKNKPGNYVFTGVPCFIKAIRLLAKEDGEFGESVAFCVGLICGHIKSRGFSEFLAWQMGINPSELVDFDFRVKIKNNPSNKYGVKASGIKNLKEIVREKDISELYGNDWGMGLFKLKPCDYCDDVVAETADITIGDAWLPEYLNDSRGTNIVITRNKKINKILERSVENKKIHLKKIDANQVVQSQGSGFNHRRDGLAYRLFYQDVNNNWRPYKRVQPKHAVTNNRFENKHRLRMQLSELSHSAFYEAKSNNRLKIFFDQVAPIALKYKNNERSMLKSVLATIKYYVMSDKKITSAIKNSEQ